VARTASAADRAGGRWPLALGSAPLRKHRGVTLEQLADSTEISVSTLSRLESGQRRPTLELLLPIARAHHVPLDELVGAPTSGDPRIYPRPIQRNGATWLPLTRNPRGPAVFKQIIPPDPHRGTGPRAPADQAAHEGHECRGRHAVSGVAILPRSTEISPEAGSQARSHLDPTVSGSRWMDCLSLRMRADTGR
jgi:transcriptional regulator with XRE-family HTH domain